MGISPEFAAGLAYGNLFRNSRHSTTGHRGVSFCQPKWRYESFSEVKSPSPEGKVVFDNGAKVIQWNVVEP